MSDKCSDILKGGLGLQSGVDYTACKIKTGVQGVPDAVSDGYDNLKRTAGSAWAEFWHGKDVGANLKDCNNPSLFSAANKTETRCIEGS